MSGKLYGRISMYIVNGTIYTMDSQNTIIEKGAIRIQDGILVDIGDIPVEPEAGEEVIDALEKTIATLVFRKKKRVWKVTTVMKQSIL